MSLMTNVLFMLRQLSRFLWLLVNVVCELLYFSNRLYLLGNAASKDRPCVQNVHIFQALKRLEVSVA